MRRLNRGLLAAVIALGPIAISAQSGSTPPVATFKAEPTYTPAAMRARIAGPVTLTCDILTDGTTSNIVVVKSLDATYGLDQQAVEALKKWRFNPATKDGVPIVAHVNVTLNFILHERDGTVLGAPAPPAAPVSAWPSSFADDITEPGATWKPDQVKLGDTTLRFESPAGWAVRNFPQGNMLLSMMGAEGRRMVMTGAPMKTPGPMRLPLPPAAVDGFGKSMASIPAMQKATLRSSGQVQIGDTWWLWLELTPGPEMLEQMPPELRDALSQHGFSELRLWSFVTSVDRDLVQIMMYDWLPDAAADRDAELRNATSTFRVILSKMSFTK